METCNLSTEPLGEIILIGDSQHFFIANYKTVFELSPHIIFGGYNSSYSRIKGGWEAGWGDEKEME